MATIGSTYLNLADVYRRTDGNDEIATIIELLNLMNPVLDDAIAVECNLGTKHRHTIRTGLPTVSWGQIYKGIPQSKSRTQSVEDTTGWVNGLSTVDERLLKLSPGSEGAIRMSEALPFMEAMNQEAATGIFYHNTDTAPETIKGLGARYNVYGGGGAGNQVIHGGGSGSDNTSIWFVTWGENYTHLLYPKGTKAGLQREDMGRQRVTDDNGDPYYVKEEMFTWHLGVAVKDWRFNARIANIDVSDIAAGTVDLYGLMRQAYYKLQNRRIQRNGGKDGVGAKRIAIYCNTDVLEALDALAVNAGSSDSFVRLKPMELEGKEVMTYRGIPIRETDALLNTEALVPAA